MWDKIDVATNQAASFSSFPIEPLPWSTTASNTAFTFSFLLLLLLLLLFFSLLCFIPLLISPVAQAASYKLQAHLFASSHIKCHHSYPQRFLLTALLLPSVAIYSIDCHRKDAFLSLITTRDTLSGVPGAALFQLPSDQIALRR